MNAVISIAGAFFLLAMRQAAFRWRELYSGLITELGNLVIDRITYGATSWSLAVKGNRNEVELDEVKCTIGST
jgi:hypothetical protein